MAKKHRYAVRTAPRKRWGWKQWLLITLVILVVLVGLLLKLRWHAWFGNVPEEPYYVTEAVDRVTLTPGEDFVTQRTIAWRSGEKPRGAKLLLQRISAKGDTLRPVVYEPKSQVVVSRSGQGCYYQVHLDSLQPGTTYLYRIQMAGGASAAAGFTMPQQEQNYNFVYIGDVQDPAGGESAANFRYLLRSGVPTDFYAFSGDQIEGPTDAYWSTWYASLQGLAMRTPIIAAAGNHEYLKRGFLRDLDPRWVPQFGYPMNGPEGWEGRSYYIDFPLMRFIVLDTTDIMWLSAINRHRAWLREALSSSKQRWQVVMFHHAVDCVREGRKNLVMHYAFKDILIEGGADLVLQGHDHGYARATTRSNTGDTIPPAFVISSASPKLYRNGFDPVHDRIGSGMQLYQRIHVDYDQIRYASYRFPPVKLAPGDTIESESKRLYDSIVIYHGERDLLRIKDMARDLPERFEFSEFGTDSKGRKKAAQYNKEVTDRERRNKGKR